MNYMSPISDQNSFVINKTDFLLFFQKRFLRFQTVNLIIPTQFFEPNRTNRLFFILFINFSVFLKNALKPSKFMFEVKIVFHVSCNSRELIKIKRSISVYLILINFFITSAVSKNSIIGSLR